MYKPYVPPINTVFPDIKVPEPVISKGILFLVHIFVRLYLFVFFGIAQISLRGADHLFDAFKRALGKESRCILAFRHPNGGEPQLLSWFVLFRLRHYARKAGVTFPIKPHVIFVYGYEVLRWGGAVARLVMPRLGDLPIHHAKMDSAGMARIYKAVAEGPYPLAIAPEGQVSYTTEEVPRLEQGAIRIGFQAADQLFKSGDGAPVEILPVSIHFRYGTWGTWTLEVAMRRIERYVGLCRFARDLGRRTLPLTERLRQSRDAILELNEKRYDIKADKESGFSERIDLVIEAALSRAENILGLKREAGDLFGRLYYLRQSCWDRIYLPDQTDLKK
ncbi:hypothetical protein FACS189444_3610 [Spirochaetia bacterium]|nr:hypothetical protein FACS189444_3610 [Spirochaetia bacterium]